MPKLSVTPIKQQHENSCWAACLRMILAHFGKPQVSDDAVAARTSKSANECQDIAEMMGVFDLFDATDDEELIAPFDEIKAEIDKGHPVVQCVSGEAIKPGDSTKGGHYVLIVGYDEAKQSINVIDPADGSEKEVLHNVPTLEVAGERMYYAQPYYCKKPD